jgi:hypothetical protein
MTAFIKSGFGFGIRNFAVAIVAIILMEIVQFIQEYGSVGEMLLRRPAIIRFAVYAGLIMCIVLFGKFSANQFIYFQF